jgi:NADH:ubiquinone oxidoreductase subunit 5 (subunit L)/multisubunit Na+/H+ antiporter MnhA subunit
VIGFGAEADRRHRCCSWVQLGDARQFDWALRVDTLTAVMLVVITTVSALVHLYSWGYMEEDPDQPRFFAYLSLFTFCDADAGDGRTTSCRCSSAGKAWVSHPIC